MKIKSKDSSLLKLTEDVMNQEAFLKEGGGEKGRERQKSKGRLTARERLNVLLDQETPFFELSVFCKPIHW